MSLYYFRLHIYTSDESCWIQITGKVNISLYYIIIKTVLSYLFEGQFCYLLWSQVKELLTLSICRSIRILGFFVLKIFTEAAWTNKAKFCRKHLWKVSSFPPDWIKTWSPRAILVSQWLRFLKSSLKLGGTMNCYFVGMMYGISCTKFPYFVSNMQLIWLL